MEQNSELLKYLITKYDLKQGRKITLEMIEKVCIEEQIDMKDLKCLLQIDSNTMWKLSKNKQFFTILNFNKYQSFEDINIIKQGNINIETFEKLQEKNHEKPYTLIKKLGISKYSYQKLKKQEVESVKIKDIKIKHIVDLILIDLKYLKKYGARFYTKAELIRICRRRKITLNQFLKYLGNNDKHYKFNKMIIKENENRIMDWRRISNAF